MSLSADEKSVQGDMTGKEREEDFFGCMNPTYNRCRLFLLRTPK